jgi:hypothetical protein
MKLCSLEATMEDHLRDLRLRPDGTIDCEYYSNRARQRWAMAPRQDEQEIPAKSPFGQVKLFALCSCLRGRHGRLLDHHADLTARH